jgi:hypothetical protein
MGSCRRDRHTASRNSAGSTTGGAAVRLAAACGPARSGTNVAVKIPGQERYITVWKIAAKPSSEFTVRQCQAFRTLVFGKLLQTGTIELQNNLLHSSKCAGLFSIRMLRNGSGSL